MLLGGRKVASKARKFVLFSHGIVQLIIFFCHFSLLSYISVEKPLDVHVSASFWRRLMSQQWLRLFLVLTYHSCRQSRLVFLFYNDDFGRKKITRCRGGRRKGVLGAGPDRQTWSGRCWWIFFYWMWIFQCWGWFIKSVSITTWWLDSGRAKQMRLKSNIMSRPGIESETSLYL